MTDLSHPLGNPAPPVRQAPYSTGRALLRLFYLGDAALAQECLTPGGTVAVAEAVPPLGAILDRLPVDLPPGTTCPFDILLIEHDHPRVDTLAILQDIVGRSLDVSVVIVGEWDEDLAVQALKLGASDYVEKSGASFRALYFRLKHLVAHAALLREQSRLREAYVSSFEQERATREGFKRRLVKAHAARHDAERRLKNAEAQVEQARRHRDADAAAIEEPSTPHRTELLARLAEAAASEEQLRRQIDEIRVEHRRQFVHLPVSICRCTQDGQVTMASQDLAILLGYDTPEALQGNHFATEVFESGDQLRWIIDRCLVSHSSESLETSWKRSDGSRIIVGVVAFATSSTNVDLVVHDITTLRVLEERLRQARRMGALGRYASEIAVTCENLLTGVRREGQQWLSRIDSDTARYQGALLLDDVTRASALLQQLAECTKEQSDAPVQAELSQMLRDLEPVLKRVAGDSIELSLRRLSTPITLDIDAERVERMLVNIAAYARERKRLGGRLTIEVTPVTLGPAFVEKFPNVRPGPHALLTVHEARADVRRRGASPDVPAQTQGAPETAPASDYPGVSIGTLQALVNECGGHLWMAVEPPGGMVLKIHLPRRALDDAESPIPAREHRRTRWISRLVRARH